MEIELDFIVETLQNKTGLNLKKPTRQRGSMYWLGHCITSLQESTQYTAWLR